MHNIVGAYLQYVNNHKAKFELKGMKTFGVTDYTNLAPLKCCGRMDRLEKCLGSTPIKNEKKNNETISQNKMSTSSMCEQSLCKV